MDLQWLLTAIAIPAGIALWKFGESLLRRWGEFKIAKAEAETLAAVEKEKIRLALAKQEAEAALESQRDDREHKQRRESLELATVLGNQSFKDDQITQMAAEAQSETAAYSQFFREQYARLTEQMVTRKELGELTQRLTETEKRVVSIHTYLLSIVQELRDDRDRYRKLAEDKDFELISGLQDELATLKAQMGQKRSEAGEG